MAQTKTFHAVVAKARALYGKRITGEQYDDMLRCRTVQELASYLKNNTVYDRVLHAVSESGIHRGQLENLLHRAAFERYARLYHYLPESRDNLFYFLILSKEIAEILRMILLIKAGNAKSFIIDLPGYLIARATVDLMAIAKAETFAQLVDILRGTEYERILKRFAPVDETVPVDYAGCEYAFYSYYYKKLFAMLDSKYGGQEQAQLRGLFLAQAELLNIEHIFRSSIIGVPIEETVRSLYPYHDRLDAATTGELLDAAGIPAMLQVMEKTRYAGLLRGEGYIEADTKRYFYTLCRKLLRTSNFASVIFFAYYNLHQVEVSNLVTIIEGIRYEVPEKQIRELLIL